MNKTIEKVVLKYCGKLTKSFYLEAILRDKEIIDSSISEQEIISFLDDCEYLQKVGEIRCPNCCRVLSYYDTEELEEDDDLECPDCNYEFVFDKYCTYYRYNVLHNKVPQNSEILKMSQPKGIKAIDINTKKETIAKRTDTALQDILKRRINDLDKYHDGIVNKYEVFKIIDELLTCLN